MLTKAKAQISVANEAVLDHYAGHATSDDACSDVPDAQASAGLRNIEAVTTAWSRSLLWWTFVATFLLEACLSLDNNTASNLAPYVTSDFNSYGLLPVATIVSSMVTAVVSLPLAKVLDLWGRGEGLVIVAIFSSVGSVMVAGCRDINTFFASKIFKAIGTSGISYVTTVLVSDITSLQNRAFFLGLTSTPFVATTWIGPPIAQSLLEHSSWRWGYGIFAILTPVFAAGPAYLLWLSQHRSKAKASGRAKDREPEKPRQRRGAAVMKILKEVDIVGLLLLCTGFILVLLAISLAKSNGSTWKSRHIIAMIVVGFVLLVVFCFWERFGSANAIVPYEILSDRTILSAALLGAWTRVGYYIWDSYFTSYLQVVNGLSVTNAGYVSNIYSLVTCLWAPFLGLIIKGAGRYKAIALVAIPVHALGAGLMIRYRTSDTNIGLIAMCQILIALSGGTLVQTEQLAVMAVTEHDKIARVLAFKALFSYIGSAVGSAISGAVWTNVMVDKLHEYLPAADKRNASAIFESLKVQLKYPFGSPQRTAIILAYEDTMRIMVIAATVIGVLSIAFVIFWKDVNLKEKKQLRGRVL